MEFLQCCHTRFVMFCDCGALNYPTVHSGTDSLALAPPSSYPRHTQTTEAEHSFTSSTIYWSNKPQFHQVVCLFRRASNSCLVSLGSSWSSRSHWTTWRKSMSLFYSCIQDKYTNCLLKGERVKIKYGQITVTMLGMSNVFSPQTGTSRQVGVAWVTWSRWTSGECFHYLCRKE